MAELAAHRAALREYDESNSRSIDRAERFELVDSSESHDPKIKKSVIASKCFLFYIIRMCENMNRSNGKISIFVFWNIDFNLCKI